MPTKRVRISRPRRDLLTPDWARRLLEGEKPSRDGEEWSAFLEWRYFAAPVPGLPPGGSSDAHDLVKRAEERDRADN